MFSRSLRLFSQHTRRFHTTRVTNGSSGPPWGTHVNEPGGRLFGEAILKPGERRKLFDWEIPYYVTMSTAAIMLYFGLNSRPESQMYLDIEAEAQRRVNALGLDGDNHGDNDDSDE